MSFEKKIWIIEIVCGLIVGLTFLSYLFIWG